MSSLNPHVRFLWWISLPIFAALAPNAQAQNRSMRGGTRMMPPAIMMQPARTNTTTNLLLQRGIRLDQRILREARRNRYSMQNYPGMSYMGIGGYGGGYGGLGGYGPTVGQASAAAPAAVSPVEAAAKAALLNEQAAAERIANRRRAFDEQRHEREMTPSADEELLSRSRQAPRMPEVLSGQTANALLADLQRLAARSDLTRLATSTLPLGDELLQHINWTHGSRSPALLKNDGQLRWPSAMTTAAFRHPRERLASLAPQAVDQLRRRAPIDAAMLRQMDADAEDLHTILRQQALRLSFQEFTEAKSFLQSLDDALIAIRLPGGADRLTFSSESQPKTILELVRCMTDRGLRVAPAIPGDEAAYTRLCDALRTFDVAAMSQPAAR